jgi:hypothetical protein
VPEAPRVMTPGRALAEAMEGAGVPLATATDLVSETVGARASTIVEGPAPACPMVGPATPLKFDPEALIG